MYNTYIHIYICIIHITEHVQRTAEVRCWQMCQRTVYHSVFTPVHCMDVEDNWPLVAAFLRHTVVYLEENYLIYFAICFLLNEKYRVESYTCH